MKTLIQTGSSGRVPVPLEKRFLINLILICSVCRPSPMPAAPRAPAVFDAVYVAEPLMLDGRLDAPVWEQAPAYPLIVPLDRSMGEAKIAEFGSVRFAWNEQFVYAAFEFTDSDVLEEGDADQLQQQRTGDVAELFLQPSGESWYWEFHATPRGRKSAFFFPSGGRRSLPSIFSHSSDFRVGSAVTGTLNDWRDRDEGWTVIMAIPVSGLTTRGESIGPGASWRVLAARYNYSRYLAAVELSSAPALPRVDFHDLPHYAVLRFVRPPR